MCMRLFKIDKPRQKYCNRMCLKDSQSYRIHKNKKYSKADLRSEKVAFVDDYIDYLEEMKD
jgi:hypothetical protein